MQRVAWVTVALLASALSMPIVGAHPMVATATDLALGDSVSQTFEINATADAQKHLPVIVSTKVARDGGVSFAHARANFSVVSGPAVEFGANVSRISSSGDILFEIADRDGIEQAVVVRVNITGLDTMGVPPGPAGTTVTLSYALAGFFSKSEGGNGTHTSTTVYFTAQANPALKTKGDSPAPTLAISLFVLVGAAVLWSRRFT